MNCNKANKYSCNIFPLLLFLSILLLSKQSFAQLMLNRISLAQFNYFSIGNLLPSELIVKFRPGVTEKQCDMLFTKYGAIRIKENLPSSIQRIFIPNNNLFQIVTLLNFEPLIEYAEPNYIVQAEFIPNDPYFIYQWNFSMLDLENAWDFSIGSNVIVTVLDTGVSYSNQGSYALAPDLANTIFLPGFDFVNQDAYPDDDNGHGTHITGTIAQSTNNLLGVSGIAHGCAIMPVKVLDSASNGLMSEIADGIYFAVNNGAQIINMSFGTYTASITLEEAIEYAYLNGVHVICSAGNNATSIPHYPSSYPSCISVNAIRYDKTRPFYSNYGPDIDICAPGGDIAVDQNLDGQPDGICQQTHNGVDFTVFEYTLFKGTSCAAAHVSGIGALILSAAGGILTPDELKAILENTSIDLGNVGWDEDFGWGLVNPTGAIYSVLPVATTAAVGPFILPLFNDYLLFNPLNILKAQQPFFPFEFPFTVPFL